MAEFLSKGWFESQNETLAQAGPVPLEDGAALLVVLEFTDGPSTLPYAITFTLGLDGASVAPGDHLAADALVRLSYDDALALTKGLYDSATALREGRVKVSGNVNAVVSLLAWLQLAHSSSTD